MLDRLSTSYLHTPGGLCLLIGVSKAGRSPDRKRTGDQGRGWMDGVSLFTIDSRSPFCVPTLVKYRVEHAMYLDTV